MLSKDDLDRLELLDRGLRLTVTELNLTAEKLKIEKKPVKDKGRDNSPMWVAVIAGIFTALGYLGDYTVLCYQKGAGRNPRKISLRFQLDDRARSDLSAKPEGAPALWVPTEIEHPDTIRYPGPGVHLFCTDKGICFEPMDLGFWYLPYADIEAYLQARTSPARASDTAPGKTSVSPSYQVSGEDQLDPGDPTSFR
jgi:hypothetical protein